MTLGLMRAGLLGGVADLGKLELIETQTISSAFADFESLGSYNVHLFQLSNVKPTTTANIGLRLSNDGGSSYISSGYQYAWQRGQSSGSFDEIKSTSRDRIIIAGDATTTGSFNLYIYAYNLLDSSKYSFFTFQGTSVNSTSTNYIMNFGSGVKPTAETHNGVRFGELSFSALASGTISLYGIAES